MDSTTQPLPASGLHYGVPFDAYRAWPAANISTIKPIRRTPLHCRWEMDHPRESEALDVGSALHIGILEPARFEAEFFVAPECDRRTKEGKATWSEAELEAMGRTILRGEAGDAVKAMAAAVRASKAASRLLDLPGQCEVSALWRDSETGLMCKARFDKLLQVGGKQLILELKTTRDASEWAFGRDAEKLGYAAQAAYYRNAVAVLTGAMPLHVFVAVENQGPYATAVWSLDDASLQTGELQWRAWLDKYAACQKSGAWPGYPDEVRMLSLPAWANKEVYDDTPNDLPKNEH